LSAIQPQSLGILLTNLTLAGRSGTEIVTRDLAIALLRAGHRPMVYSPTLGPIAEEIRRASIPVTDDILTIRETPDVIHGHHVIQTAIAAARYPNTPAIFVCHDFTAWHDRPPRLPNIRRYVSISEAFRARLTIEGGIDPASVEIVPNGVDTGRFLPGPPLPRTPRRALVFAKNHGHVDAITAACRLRNITVDVVGPAVDKVAETPETLLHDYDLVFCSALTAIEAMATLRPVIVCDGRGLAGLAMLDRYDAWRRENFGLRTFSRPVTVETILDELDLYDAGDAVALGERVRREADLETWAGRYLSLYQKAIEDHASAPAISSSKTARAVALHMQTWNPSLDIGDWTRERERLLATIERLETGLTPIAPHERIEATNQSAVSLMGFHPPESWGAWSARRTCSVRFRVDPEHAFERISIELLAFLTPARRAYRIGWSLDGHFLGDLFLEAVVSGEPVLEAIAAHQTIGAGQHWLTFEIDECISPRSAGLSLDQREIGFGLLALRLD
jgi:glycosyltransferase involved in cell wall biosynthesis